MSEQPPKTKSGKQEIIAPQYSRGEHEDDLPLVSGYGAPNVVRFPNQQTDDALESEDHKSTRPRRANRGSGKSKTLESSNEAGEVVDENLDDAIPAVEGSKSKAETLAHLRSMITAYEQQIKHDPNVKWDTENSHDALHAKISATEQEIRNAEKTAFEPVRFTKAQLDEVRDRLNLPKKDASQHETLTKTLETPNDTEAQKPAKPEVTYGKASKGLQLESIDGSDLAPLTPEQLSQKADERYLEAYKKVHSRKNTLRVGHSEMKKLEKEMISARTKLHQEKELTITDPAERARLRRENAVSLIETKRQARIEAMQQEGRWDQKLYDATLRKYAEWGTAPDEKNALKIRAVKAAITSIAITGAGAAAATLMPAAVPITFGAIAGYGAYRFARNFARKSVSNFFGKVYKKNIGEKQHLKSKGRLEKLDVKGELDDDTFADFMKRFEKNYMRADEGVLAKKMGWAGAAAAGIIGVGVGVEAVHELHDVFGHGGGHGGGHDGTHGGSTPPGKAGAPGAHPASAHPGQPNHPAQANGEAKIQPSPKYPTESIKIGDVHEGVKIDDADKALGHLAEKFQKDFPDLSKAPPSVKTFIGLFHAKDGESLLDRVPESKAAIALHLQGKDGLSALMRDGNEFRLNSDGQITLEFAKHGTDVQPLYVFINPDGELHQDFEPFAKYMRMPHHHEVAAHTHPVHASPAEHAAAATDYSVKAKTSVDTHPSAVEQPTAHSPIAAESVAHTKLDMVKSLNDEYSRLSELHKSLPNEADANYWDKKHDYDVQVEAYKARLDSYHTQYETTAPSAPIEHSQTQAAAETTSQPSGNHEDPTAPAPTSSEVYPATSAATPEAPAPVIHTPAETVSSEVIHNAHKVTIDLAQPKMYAWHPTGVQDGSTATYRMFDGGTEEIRKQAAVEFLNQNPSVEYVFVADADPDTGKLIPHMVSITPKGIASNFDGPAFNPATDQPLPSIDRNDYIPTR